MGAVAVIATSTPGGAAGACGPCATSAASSSQAVSPGTMRPILDPPAPIARLGDEPDRSATIRARTHVLSSIARTCRLKRFGLHLPPPSPGASVRNLKLNQRLLGSSAIVIATFVI